MSAYSIGVDLGGTNLRAAAISSEGVILDRVSVAVNFHAGPESVIKHIADVIKDLRTRVGRAGLRGVGIGVPGFIDIETGVILGSANLPGFGGLPVRDEIQKCLG